MKIAEEPVSTPAHSPSPEDCLMCGGYGDRIEPEQIEGIARRQMERAKTITEKLPAGYFEERVWRFGV